MPTCVRCQKNVAANAERCSHCGAWQFPQEERHPSYSELPSAETFEDEIRSLLNKGQKIEAISRYRRRTGAGLAAAKTAVETIGRGQTLAEGLAVPEDQAQQILKLLASGQKIAAIKLYRVQSGAGLKEAKDAVEALAAQRGIALPPRAGCLGVLAAIVFTGPLLVVGWLWVF